MITTTTTTANNMNSSTSDIYASIRLATTKFSCNELQKNMETPDFKKLDDKIKTELLTKALIDTILVSECANASNIKYLIDNGADPNGLPDERGGPLKYAYILDTNTKDIILKLLLDSKASVNENLSKSLLEDAIRAHDLKYIARFISAGAIPTDNMLKIEGLTPEIKKTLLLSMDLAVPKDLKEVKAIDVKDFEWPTLDDVKIPVEQSVYKEELKKIIEEPILIKTSNVPPYFEPTIDGKMLLKGNTVKYVLDLIEAGAKWNQDQEAWEISDNILEQVHKIVKLPYSVPVTRIEVGPSTHYQELDTEYYSDALFRLGGKTWPSVFHYIATKKYLINDDEKKKILESASVEKVKEIVNGKIINKKYRPENITSSFYKATKAKIVQNILIHTKLIHTTVPIVCINSSDSDGYPSNILGKHLEKIRRELRKEHANSSDDITANSADNVTKTEELRSNNLVLSSYNKKYDVIRGNPDSETIEKIVQLGAYKTTDGRMVKGHLNAKLRGGKGWLVPIERRKDVEQFIFTTLPDSDKFRISAIKWILQKTKHLIKTAYIFATIKNKEDPVVNPAAILFTVKDVYRCVECVTTKFGIPDAKYIKSVEEYANKKKIKVTSEAITLLWGIVGKLFEHMVLESRNINSYSDFNKVLADIDEHIEKFAVPPIQGLSDEETLFLTNFKRLFKALLGTQLPNIDKACMGAIAILLKMGGYRAIRSIYDSKIGEIGMQTEDILLLRTLTFKNVHVDIAVKQLKYLPLKCKIIVLIALEYYIGLPNKQKVTNRLKILY